MCVLMTVLMPVSLSRGSRVQIFKSAPQPFEVVRNDERMCDINFLKLR